MPRRHDQYTIPADGRKSGKYRDGSVLRAILRELTQHITSLIAQVAGIAEHIVAMLQQNQRMEETVIARLDAQDRKLDAIYTLLNAGLSEQVKASARSASGGQPETPGQPSSAPAPAKPSTTRKRSGVKA